MLCTPESMIEASGIKARACAGVRSHGALRVKTFTGQDQKEGLAGEIILLREFNQLVQSGSENLFIRPGDAAAYNDLGFRGKARAEKLCLQIFR